MNTILQLRERISRNGGVARKKRKFREVPNRLDPLSEPTWGRRIWAAILAKYGSLKAFEEPSGIAYTTYFAWTKSDVEPEIEKLERACRLLGFTVDEIRRGRTVDTSDADDRDLSTAGQRDLLTEIGSSADERSAVTEYFDTIGRHQRQSRNQIKQFVGDYRELIVSGVARSDAMRRAHELAINREAKAVAQKEGMRPIDVGNEDA